jgi:hypothetical protein
VGSRSLERACDYMFSLAYAGYGVPPHIDEIRCATFPFVQYASYRNLSGLDYRNVRNNSECEYNIRESIGVDMKRRSTL